jgi:PKD repeat protein
VIVTPAPTPILPVPGFITEPVSGSGSAPLVVNFHSTAQNAVTTKWNFGDTVDNEAAGTDVSHTYSAVGTYIVTQTVTNPDGTLTASVQINVNNVQTPAVADFIVTPVSGSVPLRVSFTDMSRYTSMPGSTVIYNFGGSEGTSSERNTLHTYNYPGTYHATQTVTNPYGPAGGSTKEVIITVNEVPVTLAANFNANRISGVAPLSVIFTDASTGATTYAWDFGDRVGTSTERNPSYIFSRAGSYDVVLTVGDGKGHSATKHMPITVTQDPPVTPTQLIADFNADSTGGVDPLNVQFTDRSTGAVTWQWDFGDNSPVVTTRNAEHTFGVGNWNVKLKVSDGTNFASKTMRITVTEKPAAPIAGFIPDRTEGESPLTVHFSDKSGNAVSYEWAFGDGDTSTEKSPGHIYTVEGDYTVTLTVTGISGEKSTSRTIINVSKPQTSKKGLNELNSNDTPLNSS